MIRRVREMLCFYTDTLVGRAERIASINLETGLVGKYLHAISMGTQFSDCLLICIAVIVMIEDIIMIKTIKAFNLGMLLSLYYGKRLSFSKIKI
jgi:hypothetical protein